MSTERELVYQSAAKSLGKAYNAKSSAQEQEALVELVRIIVVANSTNDELREKLRVAVA